MTPRGTIESGRIRSRRRAGGMLAGAAVAGLCAGAAGAQVRPLGDDFQVNTVTTGYQLSPVVAGRPDGGFVVAWCCGVDVDGEVVAGQVFGVGGVRLGGELEISDVEPRRTGGLAVDAEGRFVVAWGQGYSGPGGGNPSEVHVRRFEADGAPRGASFVVNAEPGREYLTGGQVAGQPDGAFVVVWEDYGGFGQRYDADALPLGENFDVAPPPAGGSYPAVAPRPDGGVVIVWQEFDQGSRVLRGQRFTAGGDRLGEVFTAAEAPEFDAGGAVAADSSGGFVVAWSAPATGGDTEVRARRFAASGEPLAPSFVVHPPSDAGPSDPAIATAEDGGFVVVWTERTPATSGPSDIHARHFAPDGTPLGGVFRVNSFTPGNQWSPALATLAGGELVVAWTSDRSAGADTSGPSVQGRLFRLPFFADGFESGDTGAWSADQP